MTLSNYTCRGFHAICIAVGGNYLHTGVKLQELADGMGQSFSEYGIFLIVASALLILYSLIGLFWGKICRLFQMMNKG